MSNVQRKALYGKRVCHGDWWGKLKLLDSLLTRKAIHTMFLLDKSHRQSWKSDKKFDKTYI